jgi:predicted O-linked N-acetylglucosamine transferase (SPINDLY family)
MNISTLQEGKKALFVQGNYLELVDLLEQEIQKNPEALINYWYLGLAYLLQEEEEAAHLVWLSAIAEQGSENSDIALESLVHTLDSEAKCLTELNQLQQAWAVRQHIREFMPHDLNNLFSIIGLSIELEDFTDKFLYEFGIIDLIKQSNSDLEDSIIVSTLEKVLKFPAAQTLDFTEACLPHVESRSKWAELVTSASAHMTFNRRLVAFGVALVELCLKHEPDNMVALGYLPRFYAENNRFSEAIEAAKDFRQRATTKEMVFFSSCILLQVLMRSGSWKDIPDASEEFKALISDFIQGQSTQLSFYIIQFLIVHAGTFAYLQDDLVENRCLQNQAGDLFLKNLQVNAPNAIKPVTINPKHSKKRLKIGYIAGTLKEHSVGWLCRWLFQHHDREAFEIYAYLVKQRPDNAFFEEWFAPHVDKYQSFCGEIGDAVRAIRKDELDILIDLDSQTLDFTCTVMALKPAPIQATWLGCDASGIPTIDYFIADPYVLPEDAQDHYQEKIWRLPHTYLAVDGFEVGIPTLRRSDLDIPEDAVIYLSSQTGLKRHPDTIRLQMQILREVPNSYFLIKGLGDQDIISNFLIKIAQEECVSPDRLKFLPMTPDVYTHRANLQIADVVLDTYPYNGATTTLETLWVGVPLVTRVGTTFSARNSYTFMKNAGITEGIAWTDEEYVEWGIRLGQDEDLRQQISWELQQSRKTSPLWNAKQFTREMENAYRSMWSLYLEQQ